MVKLGGVIGVVVAIAILFTFTEWLYVDSFTSSVGDALEMAMTVVVGVAGWLAGSRLTRRLVGARPRERAA